MGSLEVGKYCGFSLCLEGEVVRLIAGRIVRHSAGVMMLLSPAVPMVELQYSADYKEVTVVERVERLSAMVLPHIPRLIEKGYLQEPYLSLPSSAQDRFNAMAEAICLAQLRVSGCNADQRAIVEQIVTLKRCELIMEMLLEMTQSKTVEHVKYSRREEITAHFLQTLSVDYHIHRTVQYYAQQACLSQRHFSKLVREQTCKTPMEWIVQITIAHAKNLLAQSDIQVKTVAQTLGFPEQFTFRKYFKKHTGVSPSEYRAQIR